LISIIVAAAVCCAGETRCYCNEAGCVSTGYMCKSTRLGACFSQLSRDKATVWSTHGCVESLPEDEYGACMQLEEAINSEDEIDGQPVLICCGVDMCNYMDSVGIGVFFSRRDSEQSVSATGSKRVHGQLVMVTIDSLLVCLICKYCYY